MRKTLPDIQKQLKYRTLAAQAAIEGRRLADAGKRREALKPRLQVDDLPSNVMRAQDALGPDIFAGSQITQGGHALIKP